MSNETQNIKGDLAIRGDVEITEYQILTDENGVILTDEQGKPLRGDVVGTFEEKNVILTQGKRLILGAFAQLVNSQWTANTIKIGNDVGTGNILDPQPANASMTQANQNVVYETPTEEFFVTYPTPDSVRFLATINGASVMQQYPTQPNVIYTSASIYTRSDESVTYKRFPARTISSLISVDISWTIRLVECAP